MGSPPEDDRGALERAPESLPSSLAARVDARLAAQDDDSESAALDDSAATIDIDELEMVEPIKPPPRIPPRPPAPTPPPLPRVVVPPRAVREPTEARLPSIPKIVPRGEGPAAAPPTIAIPPPASREPREAREPEAPRSSSRARPPSELPLEPSAPIAPIESIEPVAPSAPSAPIEPSAPLESTRPPTSPPLFDRQVSADRPTASPHESDSDSERDVAHLVAGGVEVGVAAPVIAVDQPLEHHLESPTVLERALAELHDGSAEARAKAMLGELESATDPAVAAQLAYELGEYCERKLADEARAVKAYGRALSLDPGLRANLWAIRRVFYRRGLWPNLVKLITAESGFARDDSERADLLLEKARVIADHQGDLGEARANLAEATRLAPEYQPALLELERIAARSGDTPALLDVWERLAECVPDPARKVSYWLEVARVAASSDFARAQEALTQAAPIADLATAQRIARERLRLAELHGAASDIDSALDGLVNELLAVFGSAGAEPDQASAATERATSLRREIVALRRRQAHIARADRPEQAWDILQQALALAPADPVLLADLTELAEELGRYDDLAELVHSWQAVEGDPGRALSLSIRRADALLRGGQRDQARALLASLEASAPGFIVLTSAAERDALTRGDFASLARTYVAAGHAAQLGTWLGPGQPPAPDPGAAAALFVQAAELLAYEIATPEAIDEARSLIGRALEAVADYPPAIEAAIELDDVTGQPAAALARIRALAAATAGEARRSLLERAVRIARTHNDFDAVLEFERALVAHAPADLAMRWRLEATLAQLGRDDERAQLFGELGAAEPDVTRRGTALLAAARLRERAGQVELATELYRQVLVLWPDDAFARESLTDLLRAQERWSELVSERRAEARGLPDGAAARRALREAAWVLEVRMGDAASAAGVYEEWLQRMPDDRGALEGVARCRAAFGDRAGELVARRQLAEVDASAQARWLLGRALERAGQFDDAVDVIRPLATSDDHGSPVAALAGAFALADLAAVRGDSTMRLEAASVLAGRTTDQRLAAALAEDNGWLYALALEDFDRAADSFANAVHHDATRRGALLGAGLVGARRGDATASSAAYEALAHALEMPEAAAALHLRAAASAAVAGDLASANARTVAARHAAPDDTSALLVLAETIGPPEPPDIGDRASDDARIDRLLERAELLEMRGALADDPIARASWDLERAEALELAGRLREAGAVVTAVLKIAPDHVRALTALRRMARRAGDTATVARASYQLARTLGDPPAKLELLREAATIYEQLGHHDEALPIYHRIVAVEPGAPEHGRMLELLRERADVNGLVAAISDRLAWLEAQEDLARDREQIVPLLLERATVLRGLGDVGGAMSDLDALLDRSASHPEALRFRAELAFHGGDVDGAVGLWKRYLHAESRPEQRAEIELQLAQVQAENVNDIAGAIETLERVVAANPTDVALRERLLGLCLRASEWSRAARELRDLAAQRATPQERARDELRLGLMLRDRIHDRGAARQALDRARALDPLNLDVVRELTEVLEPTARQQMLESAAASLRAAIVANPRSAVLYDRLAQVTGWQSEVDARWLALVGLEAVGMPSIDQRQVLDQGRHAVSPPKRVRLDDSLRAALRGDATGALVETWRMIAPMAQQATGIDVAKLGFTKGDRIGQKKLPSQYEPLAGALACFAIDDVEIYVSPARTGFARALAGDTPVLCVGADVASAQQPHQRWLLARAVAVLAEGLSGLADLRDSEVGWMFAAALRAADVAVPQPLIEAAEDANLDERAKLFKHGRKQRAALAALVHHRASEFADVARFRRNALGVGHRAGLVWSGDLSVALTQLDVGRGGKSITDSPPALDLIGWSVSEAHLRLRATLGVGLGGGA